MRPSILKLIFSNVTGRSDPLGDDQQQINEYHRRSVQIWINEKNGYQQLEFNQFLFNKN